MRAGNRHSSTSPASSLVIKTDFHSSAYAKDLTYIIFLWLLVIYQSAVRQENSEDHSFLQKQLSWTSTTCVLHHFVFKFGSVWGYKRSFSFKLFSTRFPSHLMKSCVSAPCLQSEHFWTLWKIFKKLLLMQLFSFYWSYICSHIAFSNITAIPKYVRTCL